MSGFASFLRFTAVAAAITGCHLTPGSDQPTSLAVGGDHVPASASFVEHAPGLGNGQAILVSSTAYEVAILGLQFERGHYSVATGDRTLPFKVMVTLRGQRSRMYEASAGTLTLRTGRHGMLQGEFQLQTTPVPVSCAGCPAMGPGISGTFHALRGMDPPRPAAAFQTAHSVPPKLQKS